MAIDPMLYEKLSGRRGDPQTRMGEAMAQRDRAASRRGAEKNKPFSQRWIEMDFKVNAIVGIVLGLIVLAGAFSALM